MKTITSIYLLCFLAISCQSQETKTTNHKTLKSENMDYKINKTEDQWKNELSSEQFNILRKKGTEYPGTGEYYMHFEKGIYVCAACKTPLFSSENKFESHCGWPSFDDAIPGKVKYVRDNSLGMIRIEIICANCGGHLGHVFDDGPKETTGQRYCVNSLSLQFVK